MAMGWDNTLRHLGGEGQGHQATHRILQERHLRLRLGTEIWRSVAPWGTSRSNELSKLGNDLKGIFGNYAPCLPCAILMQNGCIQMYDIVWQSIILANQENMGLYRPKDGEGCFFISPWHPCLHYKILQITRIEWDVYCINLSNLLLLLCISEINSIFQNPDDPF